MDTTWPDHSTRTGIKPGSGLHLVTASIHLQASEDSTKPAGTFSVTVSVDRGACKQFGSSPPGDSGNRSTSVQPGNEYQAAGLASVPVNISVATVALDADGAELPETFYPYYGTTLRSRYFPSALRTFQGEFWPYATAALGPPELPRFSPGSVTAHNITAHGFALVVSLTQPVTDLPVFAVLDGNLSAALASHRHAATGAEEEGRTAALREAIAAAGGLEPFVLLLATDAADASDTDGTAADEARVRGLSVAAGRLTARSPAATGAGTGALSTRGPLPSNL